MIAYMEIQQSSLYWGYVKTLGWKIHKVDGVGFITKHIPFLGGLAKIQRPGHLPKLSLLIPILKSEHINTVAVEPDPAVTEKEFQKWCHALSKGFKINKSAYLPTKTIRVDLKVSEDDIFNRFAEAKRRAVRRAIKNGVTIMESNNIQDLIKIKNKSAGLFGFITTYGIKELWPIMAPEHASILLAYKSPVIARSPEVTVGTTKQSYKIASLLPVARNDNKVVGGILLLFIGKLAYYWIAGATKEGKKLFAPTLLVWEALKLSKKRGCRTFDFVGVWDERQPQYFKAWHGFTKFKEGFGGTPLYYPIPK